MKALRIVAFVIVTVALGDVLARCIDSLPVESPVLVGAAQWVLGMVDANDMHNPDTVAFVAGVLLLAASMVVVGLLLYALLTCWRRRRLAHP